MLAGQPCSRQQALQSHWAQSAPDLALKDPPKREVSLWFLTKETRYCRRSKLRKTSSDTQSALPQKCYTEKKNLSKGLSLWL